jgi:hypothetical protein
MRSAFEGEPEERRAAFRALLDDRKLRVLPDAERRFRVEGLFERALETTDARGPEGQRASALGGSGGGASEPASPCAQEVPGLAG